MKDRLKNILKQNIYIYKMYALFFSFIFNILKIFIKVDNDIILINSFGGKKYDDSPRVIFEYMKTQEKYKKYKIYWAFHNPEQFEVEGAEKIKSDTLKYFIIALKAKYWITNSSIERGLKFKNKKTIYINTWHGSAFKKMGIDAPEKAFRFKTSQYDVMYAQSKYDIDIFSKAFEIPREKFALVGLPRNDELYSVSDKEVDEIKSKLNIPKHKKVIIYAPTFREYKRDKEGCIIAPPIDIKKWKEKLSDNYIILFRAHYEINKILGIENDEFIYNVSNYENLNELMKISDIMISDYSSIMIDYSILNRPIYGYAYDYDEYLKKRGLYIDLNKELPNGICKTENELLEKIINCDFEEEKIKTKIFSKKYVETDGNARKYIDKIIGGILSESSDISSWNWK